MTVMQQGMQWKVKMVDTTLLILEINKQEIRVPIHNGELITSTDIHEDVLSIVVEALGQMNHDGLVVTEDNQLVPTTEKAKQLAELIEVFKPYLMIQRSKSGYAAYLKLALPYRRESLMMMFRYEKNTIELYEHTRLIQLISSKEEAIAFLQKELEQKQRIETIIQKALTLVKKYDHAAFLEQTRGIETTLWLFSQKIDIVCSYLETNKQLYYFINLYSPKIGKTKEALINSSDLEQVIVQYIQSFLQKTKVQAAMDGKVNNYLLATNYRLFGVILKAEREICFENCDKQEVKRYLASVAHELDTLVQKKQDNAYVIGDYHVYCKSYDTEDIYTWEKQ